MKTSLSFRLGIENVGKERLKGRFGLFCIYNNQYLLQMLAIVDNTLFLAYQFYTTNQKGGVHRSVCKQFQLQSKFAKSLG